MDDLEQMIVKIAKAMTEGLIPFHRHPLSDLAEKFSPNRPDVAKQRNDYFLEYKSLKSPSVAGKFSPSLSSLDITKGAIYVSRTSLKRLKITAISELHLDRHAEGKYLLLRTLEPAFFRDAIHTFVEDHTGDGTFFTARNMMSNYSDDCQEIFSIGAVFILKEPYFKKSWSSGRHVLCCYSPSDIMMVQEGHKYFCLTEGVEWKNTPRTLPYPDSEYEKQKTSQEWKTLGNEMFNKKKFIHATRFYSKGLLEAEKTNDTGLCKILRLNLSAAYLRSGWYEAAIKAAENALEIDSWCLKAYFRAGRANYELRNYAESKKWFTQLLQKFPDCEEAKTELKRCESRLEEEIHGTYDLYSLMLERTCRPRQPVDCADYIGPIRVVDIPGKGRGYVATKDLSPGTLLLVNKALEVVWDDDSKSTVQLSVILQLSSSIANIFMKNPNTFGARIYDLFAGPRYSKRHSDIPQVFCDLELKEEPIVDVQRLHHIIAINYHRTHSGMYNFQTSCNITTAKHQYSGVGLFIPCSFFNHHCISNANYEIYNDVIVVQTIRCIKEGEEITIQYFNPETSYTFRMELCRQKGFSCDCCLRHIDENEPPEFRMTRESLVETFMNEIMPKAQCRPVYDNMFQEVKTLIADIKSTYEKSKRKEFQLDLADIYHFLGYGYKWRRSYKYAVVSFLNAIRAFGYEPDELLAKFRETSALIFDQPIIIKSTLMLTLEMLIQSYADSGKLTDAKNWIGIMMAFEHLLSGGDLKILKHKYSKDLSSLCDRLLV